MYRWQIKKAPPKKFRNKFPEYSSLMQQLLWDRGLDSQKKINEFLYPDYDADLHDPFLMKDMKKAVRAIEKAIKKKKKIAVYGDYDADGVSATTVIYSFLRRLGLRPEVYIPDRLKEGYGLKVKAIDRLAKKGVKLIITVDSGSSSIEEALRAKKKGIDLIITDHHQVLRGRPEALAFINPHQKDDVYPFKKLAGTGVAFKLVQALIQSRFFKDKIPEGWEKWLLDVVALATVTDCVSLLGENRLLVKYGLVVLAKTKRIGLKSLMDVSGISQFKIEEKKLEREKNCVAKEYHVKGLDAYTFGFILGPRLNAASRMNHANNAFKLLIAKNEKRAQELARQINQTNTNRQREVEAAFNQIREIINQKETIPPVILEGDKNWSVGIVGVIAGRLMEKFHRPTFIYEDRGEIAKGSIRTIPEVSAIELLEESKEFLENYGGHPMAAGFTIKKKNLEEFKKRLEKLAIKKTKGKDLRPKIEIDAELEAEDIGWPIFEEIERFAPFGESNLRPKFVLQNLEVARKKLMGVDGRHLRLTLKKNRKFFEAVFFNNTKEIKLGDKVNIAFELQVNEWQGRRNLEFKILDISHSMKHET